MAVVVAGCASRRGGESRALSNDVLVETSLGDIVVRLDPAHAPVSVENFLRYVDRGAYDGTIIHRVVPGFVIQGGGHLPDLTELPGNDPIVNEWGNGLKNARGTIAMARDTGPDTATRQWYINLADNARLDIGREVSGGAGYAVFGAVVEGVEGVDAIASVATYDRPDLELLNIPVEPIMIRSVRRVGR